MFVAVAAMATPKLQIRTMTQYYLVHRATIACHTFFKQSQQTF